LEGGAAVETFSKEECGMQVVTDWGADLSPELSKNLNIYYIPLPITMRGVTYEHNGELDKEQFYQELSDAEVLPSTSAPSVGSMVDLYRKLAKEDRDILSIHISSGLSGTLNVAKVASQQVPEANITVVDSKVLSCLQGWQVEAAARAVRAGWSLKRILGLLERIRMLADGAFTVQSLNYLIHSGRLGHLKGLLASMLSIKPVIGIEKISGTLISYGKEMTLRRALDRMVNLISQFYPNETMLRVQPVHGNNLQAVNLLVEKIRQRFICQIDPPLSVAPVLGAHAGPTVVGFGVMPLQIFDELEAAGY
jgi:DegV family protein with EDD domain